jgi:hypothetical protein
VSTIHPYSWSRATAEASGSASSGSMRSAGSSRTSAPSADSASRNPVACADARVTTTRRPNSGS